MKLSEYVFKSKMKLVSFKIVLARSLH